MDNIQNIDDFFEEFFKESFDSKILEINWKDSPNSLKGIFEVNDKKYQINCIHKGNNIWTYDFYYYEKDFNRFSPELTYSGKDMFSILKTTEYGMEYLYAIKKVEAIIFGASDRSKSRKSIYQTFCQKYAKERDLIYLTKVYHNEDDNSDRQVYILYNKNIDKDILTTTTIEYFISEKL